MRTFLLALASGALLASPTVAQRQPAVTSLYTDLNLERCQRVSTVEAGESVEWRCPGHAGVPLIVLAGDGRFDIDAGENNGVWESEPTFNNPGPRVEWRARRGARPHAIIYRLLLTGEGNQGRTVLAVETITYLSSDTERDPWAGCTVAWIAGDVPNANAVARRIADRMDRRHRCGHTEPEEITHGR